MNKQVVLIVSWLPEGGFQGLESDFPDLEWVDGRKPAALDAHLSRAVVIYGALPTIRLSAAEKLNWIQLTSAGVPQDLCPVAQVRKLSVTNLAGLYGPSIAEHAFGLMTMLARNLHIAVRNQVEKIWDRTVMDTMADLHGKTLAILGLGNIGQAIARLGRAYGMRVVGCRRTDSTVPGIDRQYRSFEVRMMLAEADFVAVALPLTSHTQGLLGPAEFEAMKPGAYYINVSRGGVAQEAALLDALRNGRLAGAGLDVYATEPLPAEHPFWGMEQVIVSPHFSGERVNQSALPMERFARNLRSWLSGGELEGLVRLEWGY